MENTGKLSPGRAATRRNEQRGRVDFTGSTRALITPIGRQIMTEQPTIADIEKTHSFTFGNDGSGDNAKAPPLVTVVCNNPVCDHLNQHVEVFKDAEQPVHCGGCFAVLFCDHIAGEPTVTTEGTFGVPIQITRTACTKCGFVMSNTQINLSPIKLKDLPISMLSSLPTA
jgi:hypothetical protein